MLSWFKKKSKSKATTINLVLSTAKPLVDAKYEFCFEIVRTRAGQGKSMY